MGMSMHDLQQAAKAAESLKQAKRDLEALQGQTVVGLIINRTKEPTPSGEITLQRGRGGTGSISSIGFPDDLQSALTIAMFGVFNKRVDEAEKKLKSLGVEVD